MPLEAYLERVTDAVAKARARSPPATCVHVQLGETFMALHTPPILRLAAEAGLGLAFNSTLESLAAQAVAQLDPAGTGFNGWQLRLEADAGAWVARFGGTQVGPRQRPQVHNLSSGPNAPTHAPCLALPCSTVVARHALQGFLDANLEGMRSLDFNSSSPVYVASGLLTYNASEGKPAAFQAWSTQTCGRYFLRLPCGKVQSAIKVVHAATTVQTCSTRIDAGVARIERMVVEEGMASGVTYKERLLSPAQLQGMGASRQHWCGFNAAPVFFPAVRQRRSGQQELDGGPTSFISHPPPYSRPLPGAAALPDPLPT